MTLVGSRQLCHPSLGGPLALLCPKGTHLRDFVAPGMEAILLLVAPLFLVAMQGAPSSKARSP